MSVIEKAVQWAISIANDNSHGYSQSVRWGPSYDCSSLIIAAFRQAGLNLNSSYTGNMRSDFLANGFKAYSPSITLQRGDVLLNEANHTALFIGNGQLVHARSAEGTTDTIDSSGNEIRIQAYFDYPWDIVLRYEEEYNMEATASATTYTVKSGDTLWKIAEMFLGNGTLYKNLMTMNGLTSTAISPGQVLKVSETAGVQVTGNTSAAIEATDELAFLETLKTAINGRIEKIKENT